MQHFNILISCDQKYYEDWGYNLLVSLRFHVPWIKLHCHLVNPLHAGMRIEGVDYTTEKRTFINERNRIGYLQCARFLKVAEKFSDKDYVMTLDADTVCTRKFSQQEFKQAAEKITVLRHLKDKRWLAGLVTFGQGNFKQEFASKLLAKPIEEFVPFHDQNVLAELSNSHKYHEQTPKLFWMSIGKNGNQSVFLTLKGKQKEKDKYLNTFKKFVNVNALK